VAKLGASEVERFLQDPGHARAVLLYGDDAGLIAERARRLVRTVAGVLDDPFRVVELDRDAQKLIPDEMAALALTGGRRVIRVREASDAATGPVDTALAGSGPGFLVMEGAGLASRSKLRQLFERAKDAVAIGCYPLEGTSLAREIRAALQAREVSVDSEALAWLGERLGSNMAGIHAELEKLALYAGRGGRVDLAAAEACTGDLAGLSLEDAVFAATAGDLAQTERALETALDQGTNPVAVVRTALAHIQRLHRARLAMQDGLSATAAAKAVRPPLFFRREPDFVKALGLWSPARLAAVAVGLWQAESACKRTGAPAETICRNAVLALAQRAAAMRVR
jgi:DNA polymerase-3 subunit delta